MSEGKVLIEGGMNGVWYDLRDRLKKADLELQAMVVQLVTTDPNFSPTEVVRLTAKATGVRLALSYMDEYWLDGVNGVTFRGHDDLSTQ